ncbi:MAG: CBS domain-containing protein [candidate division NC10 bacterium]|nr:CBS domain-containing protein [candidate division NC10 bacterium]
MKRLRDIIAGQHVFCLPRGTSCLEAARYMAERHLGAVPVLEGDLVVGIFSERDLMNRVVARGLDPKSTPIGQVMTKEILVGEADEAVETALAKMKQKSVRHLPVVDGNQLVGMASLPDLLLLEATLKDEEIQMLTAYIHYVPPGTARRAGAGSAG